MVFVCKMCESTSVYITYICEECRRIRHMMNLYSKEKVLEVLDTVLVRNEAGIKHKSNSITDLISEERKESNDQRESDDIATPKNVAVVTRSKKPLTVSEPKKI